MEKTSKSTTAAEGDDRDQKLPAEPKSSSKGSAREESNRDYRGFLEKEKGLGLGPWVFFITHRLQ